MPACGVYKWQSDGSVVNIVPVAAEPSILNVTVPKFKAEGKSAREALDLLFETQAVKDGMKAAKVKRHTRSNLCWPSRRPSRGTTTLICKRKR